MSTTLLLVMLILMAAGAVVGVAMGLAGLVAIVTSHFPIAILSQKMIAGVRSFPLLAVPFFVLAGSLMNTTGIAERLFEFAWRVVGHIRGGLAHANILASVIMAGMSGSAVADAAGLGKIEIQSMTRRGYSPAFAAVVTAASSTIGPIIPPSIGLVLYGGIAEVSIGRLFLGGFLPGFIMALYMMVVSYVIAKRRGYAREGAFRIRAVGESLWSSFPALLTPVLMVGGIVSGIFTPTEAAVVTCLYVLLLGAIYRTLSWEGVRRALRETLLTTGSVLLIVAASGVISWVLAVDRMPQRTLEFFIGMTQSPQVFLLVINTFFLILGMFMDPVPLIIVLTPILMPVTSVYGIDPVHFGLIMMLNFMIGLITPPVGMAMYISSYLAEIDIGSFLREAVPFYFALLAALFTVTFVPETVLWLPRLFMPEALP